MKTYAANELLRNFQKALQALVPMAEIINISWKNDNAYDDWEKIESCLFQSFVVFPLIYNRNVRSFKTFASYGTHVESLLDYSFFRYDDENGSWRLISLRTDSAPFDTCLFEKFSQQTMQVERLTKYISLDDVRIVSEITA